MQPLFHHFEHLLRVTNKIEMTNRKKKPSPTPQNIPEKSWLVERWDFSPLNNQSFTKGSEDVDFMFLSSTTPSLSLSPFTTRKAPHAPMACDKGGLHCLWSGFEIL